MPLYLVISGLPASGKSTLAAKLRDDLSLTMVDKDEILESLFARAPVKDVDHRRSLSREADEIFIHRACRLEKAILVSWWRHPCAAAGTGTPVAWLQKGGTKTVEIHIKCPVPLATARFMGRQRHPGHFDNRWSEQALHEMFEAHANLGPLGIGPCIEVDARSGQDHLQLLSTIQHALGHAQGVA